ncbi:MAG: hypothetical protein U9O89_05890 [Thermoproteota archaeon]|nr:hypothetical protein [Thermoproteota archaeon]
MELKSKLKAKSLGVLVFSVFYAVVGIIFLYLLAIWSFNPPHLGILASLSLITAYGVFKTEKWSVWLVVVLFFLGNTFCIIQLTHPSSFRAGWLLQLPLTVYLIMTWIATIYIGAKRKSFQ